MNDKPLRVLLVEDDLEAVALFEEALVEIQESLYTKQWMRPCEFFPVDCVSEAVELLRRECYDVILLDTSLPDGDGAEAYVRIQRTAPEAPVVAVAPADDEALAVSLVRQGAQDYLVKPEIDCTLLARTIRCAIERQRVRNALRSLAFLDDLTGLYSWGGFLNLAERHLQVARNLDRDARLYLIDIDGFQGGSGDAGGVEKDLTWLLTADRLRGFFGSTAVMARREAGCFAVLEIEPSLGNCRERSPDLGKELMLACRGLCTPPGACIGCASTAGSSDGSLEALLELAESALCENKRSKAIAKS